MSINDVNLTHPLTAYAKTQVINYIYLTVTFSDGIGRNLGIVCNCSHLASVYYIT